MNAVAKISPAFKRFRESHHAVARMFACGWTISKVSHETGMSRRRLHMLLSDPTFGDLIKELAKTEEERVAEERDLFHDDYNRLMRRALSFVADKWDEAEEAGETPPFRELFSILKDGADRFGYSAKTVRVNIDASFAARLDRAIEASDKAKVIEHQPSPSAFRSPPVAHVPMVVDARQIETQAQQQLAAEPRSVSPVRVENGFPKLSPSFARTLGKGRAQP